MQRQDVTKQCDQCPCFLRVPAPEPAPGIICPDSTENCAGRKQEDAELQHAIKPGMHRRIRSRGCRISRVSPEKNVSETHRERESCVTQSDGKHMNGQPE